MTYYLYTNNLPLKVEESEELSLIVDQKFIDKSVKEFSDSIESGELYKKLKREEKGY